MSESEVYEANALIEQKLNECVDALEIKLDSDVLAFSGPICAIFWNNSCQR